MARNLFTPALFPSHPRSLTEAARALSGTPARTGTSAHGGNLAEAAAGIFLGENGLGETPAVRAARMRQQAVEPDRCPVCGRIVPQPEIRGKGRPQKYDTPECGEMASLLSRLTTLVDHYTTTRRGELPPEEKLAATQFRGKLFSLANLANRLGRPVADPTTIRDRERGGWKRLHKEKAGDGADEDGE